MKRVTEVYKSIKGAPNYEVSNFANIKNLKTGTVLKQFIIGKNKGTRQGYKAVGITLEDDNGLKTRTIKMVHRLVAQSFKGDLGTDKRIVVDHLDNNSFNNHASNLQITTQRENTSKDKRNGIVRTSRYVGVCRTKSGKWRSQIRLQGVITYLGVYDCQYSAHLAYKAATKLLIA